MKDILSSRNEIKDQIRIDDVTIQKVDVSREELDKSLFDYEQFKNKNIKTRKVYDFNLENISPASELSPILSSLCKFETIEQDFKDNLIKTIPLETVQNSYIKLQNETKLNFNQNEIKNLKLKFKNDYEAKFNSTTTSLKDEKIENVNLAEMYKWEQVEKPIEPKKKTKQKPLSLSDQSLIYSHYYNYYFKYYYTILQTNKQFI